MIGLPAVIRPAYAGWVRIVSMLPSATEIVYALGLDDELVGVTFECNEPPSARADKTVIVSGRDTSGMTPGEIDRYVREQLAAGRDLYTLDAGALAGLHPELILTQDLCRVCALPSGHVNEALDYLGCQADVLSLDPYSLDDVLATILAVGKRADAADRAARVVNALRDRLDRVLDGVAGLARPRVAVVEWVDPPFTAGHWIPDMVRAAGGEPVACTPRARALGPEPFPRPAGDTQALRDHLVASVVPRHVRRGGPGEIVVQHLPERFGGEAGVGEGEIEAGDRPFVHLLVRTVAAVHPHHRRPVPAVAGVGGGSA
jgi:iron complex transport system substrate-binding protein